MNYRIVTIAIVLLQLSCKTDKQKIRPSSVIPTSTNNSVTNIESTKIKSPVVFKKHLSELEYYKDVYSQEKMIPANDILMLSIIDSLFTKNTENELFYFVVFTKSMIDSGGFYSEILGLSCYKFITTKPNKFANYFVTASKLTENDLDNWASYIYGEIQISRENEEIKAIKELEVRLANDVNISKVASKNVLQKLLSKIRTAHNQMHN